MQYWPKMNLYRFLLDFTFVKSLLNQQLAIATPTYGRTKLVTKCKAHLCLIFELIINCN